MVAVSEEAGNGLSSWASLGKAQQGSHPRKDPHRPDPVPFPEDPRPGWVVVGGGPSAAEGPSKEGRSWKAS